ncbi:MAG: DNA polymerase III subunit gamma/tau [Porticoccaceae bacterium]|jgi:DNA polymerase-3 subunit gamma/tau|nr:DNA polymerase III subunit gamma/tau [Porticoccaceae bacterium]MBT6319938.1 DNA polymerase III subunit gamma/tau [Porticoccaceae bacterium]MBT7258610.1 DNA polymerase III subunit gamma/tau [Porticoccaceae bacterium]MDG1448171.1 DNA polymerase III subunit gamma/tau [Porticoccaceae bacterium]MDG1706051.1 DNA polymerase III subunit gamma/tau [Porticoccaceae bacterium]
MSYQVLARKWRPRSFAEMAGQEHVLQALINALDNDRLHHAYLFTGTRGVGKTTIGRILSKCLNCETGISSVPCGECSSCTEIAEGRFIDLIEVDAASRTGVDDMRDLLDNVQYAPSRGRFKIYLIDEVHMLSKSSFAALLKTLEEPPAHVKFLFATTDPQKLPITVLSRCLQFNLKNLSPERITQHLQFVLGEEAVPFEEAALWSLARAADGSMRDALSLTDQAIGHGGGQINEADVSSMLGTIERSYVVDICTALTGGTGTDVLAAISRMAEQAPDYDQALSDVLSIWHQVAILQTVPEALDKGVGNYSELLNLAAVASKEDVQLFYQICLLGRKDLHLAPDLKSGFEMVMLRALAFRPDANPPVREASSAPAPQEAESQVKKPEAAAPEAQPPVAELAAAEPPESQPQQSSAAVEMDSPPWEVAAIDKAQVPEQIQEPRAQKISLQDFTPEKWIEIRKQLSIGASLGEIASHCLYKGRDGSQLQFLIDNNQTSLYDTAHQQTLGEALSDYFAEPVTVAITFGVAEQETPRAADTREKAERLAQAVDSLNSDPSVIKFKQLFDGHLNEQSVRPID